MPCRILIIDDSSLVRSHVRKYFESAPGWQICGEAGNGKEGIEKAQEVHPDCIILDLSMPVMNGIEAAKVGRRETTIRDASASGLQETLIAAFSICKGSTQASFSGG